MPIVESSSVSCPFSDFFPIVLQVFRCVFLERRGVSADKSLVRLPAPCFGQSWYAFGRAPVASNLQQCPIVAVLKCVGVVAAATEPEMLNGMVIHGRPALRMAFMKAE